MYWILWLLFGGICEGLFCAFVLPEIIKKTFIVIKSERPLKPKFLWLMLMSFSIAFAVILAVFTIAMFVCSASNNFIVGWGERSLTVITWPFYLIFLTPIIFGVILATKMQDFKNIADTQAEIKPHIQKTKKAFPNKIQILWLIVYAFWLLALISATIILSMIFNYILLKLFSLSSAKNILLGLVVAEVCVLSVVVFLMRNKIRRLKNVRYKLRYIATVASFVLYIIMLVLLVAADRQTVDTVFMWTGSVLFIFIPLFAISSFVIVRSKLKTEPKKSNEKNLLNKERL